MEVKKYGWAVDRWGHTIAADHDCRGFDFIPTLIISSTDFDKRGSDYES